MPLAVSTRPAKPTTAPALQSIHSSVRSKFRGARGRVKQNETRWKTQAPEVALLAKKRFASA